MRQPDSRHGPGRLQHNHESVPVHLTGLTQTHGVLMVLEGSVFTITQLSNNAETLLGMSATDLLGTSLLDIVEAVSAPATQLGLETCTQKPGYIPITITTPAGIQPFDGLVHRMDGATILELEPSSSQTAVELTLLQNRVQQATDRLRAIDDIHDFLQAAVVEIQALTKYDRVMVYQFDNTHAGSVVAEVKPPETVSYLGLHYPATDIPTTVRQLYQQNIVRSIPDLTAPLAELVAMEAAALDSPLDLSQAVLRGVDPCCLEFHQNMGVTGLLVIALVRNNQLWGLISCHHPTAQFLPYTIRSACEVLGQLVAAELASKVNRDELNYLQRLQAIQTDFVNSIAQANDFQQALIHPEPRLLDVVNAQGAAICLDHDITLIGNTPALEDVQNLIIWAMETCSDSLFYSHCLVEHYPHGDDIQDTASGLIVLKISQLRRYLILWFRPEVLQTVHWAGNPQESFHTTESGDVLLCPRTSFEAWKETVQATALPWQRAELDNAIALKNAIVGIVLNKADELAQINQQLERSNRELESFAYAASHDLKEPLRGITNFSNLLLRRYGDTLDATGVKRLTTLVNLAERMDQLIDALLKFSRLGQTELTYQPTDLNVLLSKVIEVLQTGRDEKNILDIKIPRALPTVRADPTLLTEVFSNLLSNALKYTDRDVPRIEIGYLPPDAPSLAHRDTLSADRRVIYVKDDGIGIQERHFQNIFRLFKRLHERNNYGGGTGVGLTIAQKIIERHGGQIWVESNYGEGTTFYFVLNYEEK